MLEKHGVSLFGKFANVRKIAHELIIPRAHSCIVSPNEVIVTWTQPLDSAELDMLLDQ